MMDRNEIILKHYTGSTFLNFLCGPTGLTIDQVNFISCQLFALFLSYILKTYIKNPTTRLYYTLISGLGITLFCFGSQLGHIIILAGISYLLLRTLGSRTKSMPWIVLISSMLYLSYLHLKRQFWDPTEAGYTIDITGPLMVLTQKVTSLAFSVQDGIDIEVEEENETQGKKIDDNNVKKKNSLTELQTRLLVPNVPEPLIFCSYVFQFQSMLAGPLVFYGDFVEFIQRVDDVPSPYWATGSKLVRSVFFVVLFLGLGPIFDCQKIRDTDFLNSTSAAYKLIYITIATTLERCKYYHAWILADAVCNMSGLGYDHKKGTWDLVSNVHAFQFELGLNLKESLDLWNIGTMKWLRFVIYERTSKTYRTGLVYFLSAIWHGFYPGYYITFVSGALFTSSARVVRRLIRPYFMSSKTSKLTYDIVTWATTRLVLAYTTFAFVVQDFIPSLNFFIKIYFCFHILGLGAMFVLPLVISNKNKSQRTTTGAPEPTTPIVSKENEQQIQQSGATSSLTFRRQSTSHGHGHSTGQG